MHWSPKLKPGTQALSGVTANAEWRRCGGAAAWSHWQLPASAVRALSPALYSLRLWHPGTAAVSTITGVGCAGAAASAVHGGSAPAPGPSPAAGSPPERGTPPESAGARVRWSAADAARASAIYNATVEERGVHAMQTYGIGLQRQAKGGQPGGARQPGGSLLGSLSDSAASLASAPAGGARVSPNLSAAGPALPVASFSVEPVRGLATGGGADAKDQTLAIQGPVPYGGGPAGPAAYAAAVADARQAASGWKPSTGLGLERMPAQARPLGDWEAALAASVAARAPNPGRGQTAARGGAALPPEAKTKSPAPGARRLLAVAARGAEDSETAAGQPGSGSGVAGVHTGGAKVKLAVKVRRDERADPARTGLGPAAAEGAREAALEYARVRDAHGVAARGSAEGRPAADGQQEARGVAAAAGPTGFGFDVAGEGGGGLRSARLAVAAPGALARSGAVDALLAAVAPLAAHARSRVAQVGRPPSALPHGRTSAAHWQCHQSSFCAAGAACPRQARQCMCGALVTYSCTTLVQTLDLPEQSTPLEDPTASAQSAAKQHISKQGQKARPLRC